MEKQSSSKGLTAVLAVLGGLLMAGVRESLEGFLTGAILGALVGQILFLRQRTRALSEELDQLRSTETRTPPAPAERVDMRSWRATSVEPVAPSSAGQQSQSVEKRASAQQASSPAQTSFDNTSPPRAPASTSPPPPPPSSPPPGEPPTSDGPIDSFIRWLKGGNPLARAGIVILFFGAAFLARYAAEHRLFPIELRFIAIASGAFALLFTGWRLRESQTVYARLLQGGGVAGLYLTVFSATKLFQLLPVGLALGLMIVIALAAAILAVGQNALSLAVLGTAGGFAAPILVSTGSGDHVALFGYYTVLNLGVFAVAWFKSWRVLNVLGFVFTFGVTTLWRVSGYERDELFSADAFLILFFLLYVGVSILSNLRQPANLKNYVSGSLVFGLPVVAFTLHASLVAHIEYALAWSAFALGAFYLALGWALYATRRASLRLLTEAFAALGVIFASLAIPLAFDTRTTAAMWAVEGAGLLWLGVRQQRKLARIFAMLLQSGAGLGYLAGLSALHGNHPVINSACIGALLLAVSGFFTGYWLYRNRERAAPYEEGVHAVFALWALGWWLFGGLNEISRFLPDHQLGASLAFVSASAALLAWLAAPLQWRLPRTIGTYVPAAAALAGLMVALFLRHPFAQWGAGGWIAVLLVQLVLLRVTDSEPVAGERWLHAGLCWLLALLTAWESAWQIAERTSGVWADLPWGLAPALIAGWLGRRVLWPAWPLEQHAHEYRLLGGAPLVIVTLLWVAIMSVSSRGDAGWLPYLPLLNPLDVSVLLCFAAVGLWWTSLEAGQRQTLWGDDFRLLAAGAAVLAFVWLNSALLRSLHHNWGAPITLPGMMRSTLVQSSLSIFWGVLGFTAMTLAARRFSRAVWSVGAGLMAVVVVKLFLVDLSSVGTIARITSFLSVGALLLITGYLAPLPPRRDLEQAEA